MEFLLAAVAIVLAILAYNRSKKASDTLGELRVELDRLRGEVERQLPHLAEPTITSPASTGSPEAVPISQTERGEVTECECSECGAQVAESDKVCPHCGASLEETSFVESTGTPDVNVQSIDFSKPDTVRSDHREVTSEPPAVQRSPTVESTWGKLEKRFVENWTGILGSIVMVLGVSFLGIYAALQLAPFYRFILMLAFAGGLWGVGIPTRRKERWAQFSNWLGSSGAAIFLFACFGSGYIPGLLWIENSYAALAFVALGIIVNMYFGYLGSSQVFMSLHVVLSLATLIVIPQNATLAIGAAVTVVGVLLRKKHQWDKHLLLAVTAYCIFQLRWFFEQGAALNTQGRWIGVCCTVAVGASAAFMHYRKDYATTTPQSLPLTAHILNWLYSGFLLALLSTESKYVTFPLAIGALTAYFLARHARKIGIPWVYRCDTVISQIIGILALTSLGRWGVDAYTILALLFSQAILFSFLMWVEKEKLLAKLATMAGYVLALVFISGGILRCLGSDLAVVTQTMLTTASALGVGLAIHWIILRRYGEAFGSLKQHFSFKEDVSFLGVVVGALIAIIQFGLRTSEWFGYQAFAMATAMMVIGSSLNSRGIKTGLLFSIVCIHLTLLATLIHDPSPDYYHHVIGLGLMFAATCMYLADQLRREIRFSLGVALLLALLSELMFVGAVLSRIDVNNSLASFRSAAITFGGGSVGLAFYTFALKKRGELLGSISGYGSNLKQSLLLPFSFLLGSLPAVVAAHLYVSLFSELTSLILIGMLLLLRNRLQSNGLGLGLILSLVVIHGMSWSAVYGHEEMELWTRLTRLLPLFALSALAIRLSYVESMGTYLRWPGIYLLGTHAAVVVYLLTNPISSLLPGITWLMLSLAFLLVARSIPDPPKREYGQPARYLLHLGYLLIAAFLIRHFLYHLQVESYIGGMKLRFAIALFAIAVFLLWSLTQRKPGGVNYRSWVSLHPLFVELVIAFSISTLSIEVDNLYLPLIWATAAILLYLSSRKKTNLMSRLRFYALLFGWGSTIQLAAVTSTLESPATVLVEQPTLLGGIVLALNIVFLVMINNEGFLTQIQFPEMLTRLARTVDRINRNKNVWIYYPFFFSSALFLYWRFDAAILTLLLVSECFVIFALSIRLRVAQFKTFSMIALGLCLVRLVVFDLAQSGTLMRGVVFLGVGCIMILMNYLYKRYRVAYEK